MPKPKDLSPQEELPVVTGYQWRRCDPREHFWKRGSIVVFRPSPIGQGLFDAGVGTVETKNGYSVLTSFQEHPLVGEDDRWPEGWLWIEAPDPTTSERDDHHAP